jgi:probable rRNA maturation factor
VLQLEVHSEVAEQPDDTRIAALLAATAQVAGSGLTQVSVNFVTPERMTELNTQYRNTPKPTDVLSFPFDDSFPHGVGGELYVCPEVASRQAEGAGHSVDKEIDLLIVHGALHLLGHEDDTERGRAEMDKQTKTVLDSLKQQANG